MAAIERLFAIVQIKQNEQNKNRTFRYTVFFVYTLDDGYGCTARAHAHHTERWKREMKC